MKYKAIIFDLDGTLLDSLTGIAEAMNALLTELEYPTHSLDAYKYFVGDGVTELVYRTIPEKKRETADIPALVRQYRRIYNITWPTRSRPYEGIPELLVALSAQKVKLGVLSNKSEDFVQRMITALIPNGPFAIVRGNRPDMPLKPDPTHALHMAEIMNVDPTETIFMGDSGIDMQTAVRANMYPVGVLWGFRQKDELLENGAQKLLQHPLDLLKLFE